MSGYRLSALARSDLDEIWIHVAEAASVETADRLIDEIVTRFGLLARHREAGRLRKDIAPSVRSFPVQHYVIYYRPGREHIEIARVLHGSRDQQIALLVDEQ